MIKRYYIDPWMNLMAQRHRIRQRHWDNPYKSSKDLEDAILAERKRLLGSDFSLEALVRRNRKPDVDAIERLSRYLAKRTAFFLTHGNRKCSIEDPETFCFHFFYFTIQIYANWSLAGECLDDLIQMAEAFQSNPAILGNLVETNLCDLDEDHIIKDCWTWITELDATVPTWFRECVQAAVAVLTGVMPDPLTEKNEKTAI